MIQLIKHYLIVHKHLDLPLNNIENTYELAKTFYPIFFKEVKYCNECWIVLNKSTNLWNKVKKTQIFIFIKN